MIKRLLSYYLISTGTAIAIDAISTFAVSEKVNQEMEAYGYDRFREKKESISDKIAWFLESASHNIIPVHRCTYLYYLVKYNDLIAKIVLATGLEIGLITKNRNRMPMEEYKDELIKKKKHLETLKASINEEVSYIPGYFFEEEQEDDLYTREFFAKHFKM